MSLRQSKYNSERSSPLICRICGDLARGLNFSVISCMSCKMFFRRHAQSALSKAQCRLVGQCTITRRTRRFCLPCRLKRCFEAGMDMQLIRHTFEQNKPNLIPQPRPLSLLEQDRSTLTLDEWDLLSNIINTYNEQNLLLKTQDFLKNQFSLPPKIRSKDSTTLNHIGFLFLSIHKFIERCPLFYTLSAEFSQALIKRNLNAVGGFNAFFLAKQIKVFENETYSKYIDNIYGDGYSSSIIKASQRLQQNEVLVKTILLMMIFLSNCGIVSIDYSENMNFIVQSKKLIDIQNVIVTMLWKYMIYQYGFNEATLKFLSLVKSILDMIQRMHAGLKIEKHWNMIGNIVEQTTRALTSEDNSFEQ